ncbi:sugar kinase [Sinomonas atrocyanea]|uniref:Sugar kinase n=1 Tax=Sinomonas atrocyanea TaxID=37927 RepID=A0A127A9H7_9MICC|nr:sugar kinase [Sinomonas atrocyanea]AMM34342.1 sugar kinase [Sinomonas atrocyanea]GEB64577.1 sugar kinase [Sinomonas atrocyanea]GGG63805.1 sugar kinase [Sinomonas atrocyanea]
MSAPLQEGTAARTDVVTLGETMALFKAGAAGPLAHVHGWSLGIGGAESNVAVALQRLGTPVTWIGRVGADSLGDLVARELVAEGIDVRSVRDAAPTGLMVKERRTADALKVWYYRAGSAGSRLAPEDLPAGVIEQSRLLHVTGITPALSPSAAAAAHDAIDRARAAGVLVSFDLNYRAALWSQEAAGEQYRQIIAKADIVFAGDDEAAIAVGPAPDPWELARRIAALGPSQVILKRGAQGCLALVDGAGHAREAVPVKAVDTVGAGDAFVGGYLSELLLGADVDQRLLLAAQVGAFACLVPGDWEGAPRRSELHLLDPHDPVTR